MPVIRHGFGGAPKIKIKIKSQSQSQSQSRSLSYLIHGDPNVGAGLLANAVGQKQIF